MGKALFQDHTSQECFVMIEITPGEKIILLCDDIIHNLLTDKQLDVNLPLLLQSGNTIRQQAEEIRQMANIIRATRKLV